MADQSSDWEKWIGWSLYVATACLTPMLAFFAYRIARAQKEIAWRKLQLDLFDRRMKILQDLQIFIEQVLNEKPLPPAFIVFYDERILPAYFLFDGSHVWDYLQQVRQRAEIIDQLSREIEEAQNGPANLNRSELVQKRDEQRQWMLAQANEAKNVFAPFVSIR